MNLDTAVPAFGASRVGRVNPMIVLRIAAIAAGLCLALIPAFAAERLRLKSEVMVEKMLEPAWRAFQDPTQPLAARVSMMQTIGKFAGLLDQKNEATGTAVKKS